MFWGEHFARLGFFETRFEHSGTICSERVLRDHLSYTRYPTAEHGLVLWERFTRIVRLRGLSLGFDACGPLNSSWASREDLAGVNAQVRVSRDIVDLLRNACGACSHFSGDRGFFAQRMRSMEGYCLDVGEGLASPTS